MRVKHIPIAEMIADDLTKPVSKPKFVFCVEQMGIKYTPVANDAEGEGGLLKLQP